MHSRQTLRMTGPVWLGLAVVAVAGLSVMTDQGPWAKSLNYTPAGRWPGKRLSETRHRFDVLGVQMQTPDGWTYLASRDDAVVNQPTFVHFGDQVVIQLFRWNPLWLQENQPAEFTKRKAAADEPITWLTSPDSISRHPNDDFTLSALGDRELFTKIAFRHWPRNRPSKTGRLNTRKQPSENSADTIGVLMIDLVGHRAIPPVVTQFARSVKRIDRSSPH